MYRFIEIRISKGLYRLCWQGYSFVWIIMVVAAVLCWNSVKARASGFALVQQGTAAMAQGNAFVADASDASAIYYNPAGLNQLKGVQFYSALILNSPDREYHSGGWDAETDHRWYHSGTAYLAVPVHKRVVLGLGYFSPFGMGTSWSPTWPGRYLTTLTSLKTYCINPVVSVKVLDNLSLAAGFDVMWSKVKLQRKVPIAVKFR
jgi:long-chain fatty acid transport protein